MPRENRRRMNGHRFNRDHRHTTDGTLKTLGQILISGQTVLCHVGGMRPKTMRLRKVLWRRVSGKNTCPKHITYP